MKDGEDHENEKRKEREERKRFSHVDHRVGGYWPWLLFLNKWQNTGQQLENILVSKSVIKP